MCASYKVYEIMRSVHPVNLPGECILNVEGVGRSVQVLFIFRHLLGNNEECARCKFDGIMWSVHHVKSME